MKKRTLISIIICGAFFATAVGGLSVAKMPQEEPAQFEQRQSRQETVQKDVVASAIDNKPKIVGEKIVLEDPKLKGKKTWVEYVEYSTSGKSEEYIENEKKYKLTYYDPTNYVDASVMSVAEYKPQVTAGKMTSVNWDDIKIFKAGSTAGCIGVALTGGVSAGFFGNLGVDRLADSAKINLIDNAPYYGDEYYAGISNDNYYTMDSITIETSSSKGFNVEKTKALDLNLSYSGGSKFGLDAEAGVVFAKTTVSSEFTSQATTSLGYGLDFSESNSGSSGTSVSRTFEKRQDALVKNTPWKLVEFTAKIPLKVEKYKEVVSKDSEKAWVLDDQFYISINLMSGIVREFANGYIEHWNTGELVFRADFFEKFLTTKQVIINAKNKTLDAAFSSGNE